MSKTACATVLLLGLLLPGCYFQKRKENSYWKQEQVASIQVGKTTKAEVLEALGPPKKIIKLHEAEAYVFEHVVEKRTGFFAVLLVTQRIDQQRDAVTVIVDKSGLVSAVGSRFDAEKASFGSPWGD